VLKEVTKESIEEARILGKEIAQDVWRKSATNEDADYNAESIIDTIELDCKVWSKVRNLDLLEQIVFVSCLERIRELTVEKIKQILKYK